MLILIAFCDSMLRFSFDIAFHFNQSQLIKINSHSIRIDGNLLKYNSNAIRNSPCDIVIVSISVRFLFLS